MIGPQLGSSAQAVRRVAHGEFDRHIKEGWRGEQDGVQFAKSVIDLIGQPGVRVIPGIHRGVNGVNYLHVRTGVMCFSKPVTISRPGLGILGQHSSIAS